MTSVTTDGSMLLDSRLANITDGVLISNGDIAETTTNLSVFSAESKVVFKLDGTYDIGRIDVFTVHCQRNGQKYTVDASADGGTTWAPLTSVSSDNVAGDWKVRRIRLSGRNGAAFAKGVNALRFAIAIPGGKPPLRHVRLGVRRNRRLRRPQPSRSWRQTLTGVLADVWPRRPIRGGLCKAIA